MFSSDSIFCSLTIEPVGFDECSMSRHRRRSNLLNICRRFIIERIDVVVVTTSEARSCCAQSDLVERNDADGCERESVQRSV